MSLSIAAVMECLDRCTLSMRYRCCDQGHNKSDTCTTRHKLMLRYVLLADKRCLLGCDTMKFHRQLLCWRKLLPHLQGRRVSYVRKLYRGRRQ
jgi:hypothetical protein